MLAFLAVRRRAKQFAAREAAFAEFEDRVQAVLNPSQLAMLEFWLRTGCAAKAPPSPTLTSVTVPPSAMPPHMSLSSLDENRDPNYSAYGSLVSRPGCSNPSPINGVYGMQKLAAAALVSLKAVGPS